MKAKTFGELLTEMARGMRRSKGDTFEIIHGGARHQLRIDSTEHGKHATEAYAAIMKEIPGLEDIAVLNECVAAGDNVMVAFLGPCERFQGTPLEDTPLHEMVLAFAAGAVLSTYERVVRHRADSQESLMHRAFFSIGREWARREMSMDTTVGLATAMADLSQGRTKGNA